MPDSRRRKGRREPLGIQSVEIAARILRALAEGGGVLALRDLAAATGMHRGKVHRYLISLARAGLVTREQEFGIYSIGPLAISAGLTGLRRLNPVRLAYEALPALRDRIGETVVLAVWGERGATVSVAARLAAASDDRDWDTLAAMYAEDATFVDRRHLGLGEVRGRETIVRFSRGLVELAPDLRYRLVRLLDVASDGWLARADLRGHSADGGEVEVPYLALAHLRDGLIARFLIA